ncbi:MAG: hypothetical protein BRD23_06550 [Halobacteriales archaeon SW_9_67_25]|nr:MAG: hypothetical protein BRD23_06550 [Halobacteriales archaeon SW_9_67_25]
MEDRIRVLPDETASLREWHRTVRAGHDSDFAAAKELAGRLGAHYESGVTEVGFWTPEVVEAGVPHDDVYLEILTPTQPVEVFDYVHPVDGTVVYYCYRESPDGAGVLFVGNMEGPATTVHPTDRGNRQSSHRGLTHRSPLSRSTTARQSSGCAPDAVELTLQWIYSGVSNN